MPTAFPPPFLIRFLMAVLLMSASFVRAQPVPGVLDVHWNEGAEDCIAHPQPPIQVHRYNSQTFILRESLCATSEAPFLYLLVGSNKALLIDTGDVADPKQMPLASTVTALLAEHFQARIPLIVVHTHGHLDHRSGDPQFEHLSDVQVVPADLAHVQSYFGFPDWPNGSAQLDLGDRTVDVIPIPGHHPAHAAFYDRATGLFFSGDFLLPGRLLIEEANADLASARRAAEFAKDRPIAHVLGAHIELDQAGGMLPWGSHHHPRERPLEMTKQDLLALPAAVAAFNGFYTTSGPFTLINPLHCLEAAGSVAVIGLAGSAIWLRRFLRRRKAARLRFAELRNAQKVNKATWDSTPPTAR
jgi:hydroxyacylglutathione hydrolase